MKPKWHVSCRQNFTNKCNLTFVRKEFRDEDSDKTGDSVCKFMRSSIKQTFVYIVM